MRALVNLEHNAEFAQEGSELSYLPVRKRGLESGLKGAGGMRLRFPLRAYLMLREKVLDVKGCALWCAKQPDVSYRHHYLRSRVVFPYVLNR